MTKVKNSTELEQDILSYQVVYKSDKSLEYPVKGKLDQMMSRMNVSYDTYQLIKENYDFINEITAIESSDGTRGLYDYVSKNHKQLSRMPKDTTILIIKSKATTDWAKKDLRDVNGRNVRSKNLKSYLRNFND